MIIQSWQVQEAKNKFSQVIQNAQEFGPQAITKHGAEVAFIISAEEYRRMLKPKTKLSEFFCSAPVNGIELDLTRDPSPVNDESVL